MNQLRSRAGLRLLALALALCAAALVIAACAPAAPTVAPTASVASAPTQAAAPQATQPAATTPTAAVGAVGADKQWSQDPAPSLSKSPAAANTRHFQGDPNAPVVLIEASDFQ
jgi:hypothetical protein